MLGRGAGSGRRLHATRGAVFERVQPPFRRLSESTVSLGACGRWVCIGAGRGLLPMTIGIMDVVIPARALPDATIPDFRNNGLLVDLALPDTQAETCLRRG